MRIGFISTRLAGTDGVSLEAAKLADVLRQMGHEIYYCAGELAGDVPGMLIPEIHFRDETAVSLGNWAFNGNTPDPSLNVALEKRAKELKNWLREFINQFQIDFLILQNVFAIPMQLPLAQALSELMVETGLPGLAHNHDFYWERQRFNQNRIPQYLDTYFPPDLPRLSHAVINSLAQNEIKVRRNINSICIPNVFDFASPPPGIDDFSADFREAIGLTAEDWLILQPTRVVPRKGIELAIELVARLQDPRAKLVITHHAGDEGLSYLHSLQKMASEKGVDLRYVAEQVDDTRHVLNSGQKIYALWDTYPHADLVAYPSLYEGFGNALIETIYFRKPALVNRYSVYAADIGPLGFQFAEIDGVVSAQAVETVRSWLENPAFTESIVDQNYQLGQEHFSYQTLKARLQELLL